MSGAPRLSPTGLPGPWAFGPGIQHHPTPLHPPPPRAGPRGPQVGEERQVAQGDAISLHPHSRGGSDLGA